MRRALGLWMLTVVSGCTSCWTGGGPCGPAGGHCGAAAPEACGPCVCVECPCYCRRLDDWHTTVSARKCAALALRGNEGKDYRLGFTQAYVDIALGRTGVAPPVPPPRYWSVCFRSGCGQERSAEWYAGYREGAAQAAVNCNGTCRTIASSGTAYLRTPVPGGLPPGGPGPTPDWFAGGAAGAPFYPGGP